MGSLYRTLPLSSILGNEVVNRTCDSLGVIDQISLNDSKPFAHIASYYESPDMPKNHLIVPLENLIIDEMDNRLLLDMEVAELNSPLNSSANTQIETVNFR